MKKLTLLLGTIIMCLTLSINMTAQNRGTQEAMDNLKPYPETIDSLERHVIFLEPQADESQFKIELFAGKMMEVDCNKHGLIGKFKEDVVQGWGYNYYVFETEGKVFSTMMGCMDNTKTERFIAGETVTVRYNSRLPIVVYLPKGYDLKYKVWTAAQEFAVIK